MERLSSPFSDGPSTKVAEYHINLGNFTMKNNDTIHVRILCIERCIFLRIQKCENCGNQFSWREVVMTTISGSWGYQPLVCRKCGTKHKVTMISRILVAFPIPILLFIANLCKLPILIPFYIGLPIILILFFAIMLSFPYFARYKASTSFK